MQGLFELWPKNKWQIVCDVLFTKLGMELEEMLGKLHSVSKALGIKTNAKKTMVMTIHNSPNGGGLCPRICISWTSHIIQQDSRKRNHKMNQPCIKKILEPRYILSDKYQWMATRRRYQDAVCSQPSSKWPRNGPLLVNTTKLYKYVNTNWKGR